MEVGPAINVSMGVARSIEYDFTPIDTFIAGPTLILTSYPNSVQYFICMFNNSLDIALKK